MSIRWVAMVSMTLVVLVATTRTASAQQCPDSSERVIVYEHPFYRGDTLALRPGTSVPRLRSVYRGVMESWNDSISSIEIPDGLRVTLFSDANYYGRRLVLDRNRSNLASVNGIRWDNIASSISVDEVTQCSGSGYAIFYDRLFFRGRSFVLYQGESLRRLRSKRRGPSGNWDDRIASLKIVGDFSLTLYEDERYGGERVTLYESVEDLDAIGDTWTDRASSLRLN